MYLAAKAHGLTLVGFSEHSPRPMGFSYTHEYRESLQRHLNDYVQEVTGLRAAARKDPSTCQVLFGMEMDWLRGEEDFARHSAEAFDFDYLIGSVHFIDHWGFDDGRAPWDTASHEQCEQWYEAYFSAWEAMLRSRLYNIAAHPDLIKIFSLEHFHAWLSKKKSQEQVFRCLEILGEAGMAMEISSAGLRKACHEIYPCAHIMEMAAQLHLPITFASDAHTTDDVAYGFDQLEAYAKSFGFTEHVFFDHGKKTCLPL